MARVSQQHQAELIKRELTVKDLAEKILALERQQSLDSQDRQDLLRKIETAAAANQKKERDLQAKLASKQADLDAAV